MTKSYYGVNEKNFNADRNRNSPIDPVNKPIMNEQITSTPDPVVCGIKHAMAISTYLGEKMFDRCEIIKESITSLLESGYPGIIHVVDDCSKMKDHLNFIGELNEHRVKVYVQEQNGGLSKVKNRGIKQILEGGSDFGFLADDDVHYEKGWWNMYLEAYEKTGIPHFCCTASNCGHIAVVNGFNIRNVGVHQGSVITFSKKMIDEMGYYKVLPCKLGHEHTQWTNKAVHRKITPFIADTVNSHEFLRYIGNSCSTRPADFYIQASTNLSFICKELDINEKCII